MRVFISSVIGGYEVYRDAAAEAIESLGYTSVRAEDFGASAEPPQRACLEAARQCELTIVLLGERYGDAQNSGLSATHEEFREAREHRSIIVLIEQGIDAEPAQKAFIREAQEWATGRLTEPFRDPTELHARVTRAVHEHVLRQQAGDSDPEELFDRARALLPTRRAASTPQMHLAVVGGPRREVWSPAQLDDPGLGKGLIQTALFGERPIFHTTEGSKPRQVDDGLLIEQASASVELRGDGAVRVTLPAVPRRDEADFGVLALIEEHVAEKVEAALLFAAGALENADPHHRLSAVLALVAIEGGYGWQTRAEHMARPNVVEFSATGAELVIVPEEPRVYPRAAISAAREEIVEDLVARLRRRFRG
jgi:hypothetical protein